MGRGHSGSTVLDLILGNHNEIIGVGELTSGFGFRNGLDTCSCGELIEHCIFWKEVWEELKEKYPDTNMEEYSQMMDYMVRFYRLPQLVSNIGLPDWVTNNFTEMTFDLYKLIAVNSECNYIVDSSKELAYAYYLLKTFPVNVKIIHLVRDGRGVMWSRLRRLQAGQPFQFLRYYLSPKHYFAKMLLTVLSWNFANYWGILLRSIYPKRVLQVRYEDLGTDLTEEVLRIGKFLNLNMTKLVNNLENQGMLKIGHNIGGNQMKNNPSGIFRFQPDYAWQRCLPTKYKALFVLISLPLALYYGYI